MTFAYVSFNLYSPSVKMYKVKVTNTFNEGGFYLYIQSRQGKTISCVIILCNH